MRKWIRMLMIGGGVLAIMSVVAVAVAAGGPFTDDDSSPFESDIEWMYNAGVTTGCNPPTNDLFCPEDELTRGQMAAFMRRLARYLDAEDGTPSEADNAATLGGFTRQDLMPLVTGKRSFGGAGLIGGSCPDPNAPCTLGTTGDPDRVITIDTNTVVAESLSAVAEATMSGTVRMLLPTATTAENHYPICWISTTQLTTFDPSRIAAVPARMTLPAGSAGLQVGSNYLYSIPFSVYTAEFVPGGTSKTLYFQCVDWRTGTNLTEFFEVEASTIVWDIPVRAAPLQSEGPFDDPVDRPNDERAVG